MSAISIEPGGLIVKDPTDECVVTFDWSTSNLAVGVTVSTSTFTLTTVQPVGDTSLTYDNPTILAGSRTTQLRVKGGVAGGKYIVANKIVTSETPTQTKERSFRVSVQDR